eukprot:TRINITY_DN17948_c0_g4_i1.p1 TRINITY_DN17948_c0_g4~~TRINITY_DN17948_c0_g4_i1.p1  ORF type:complete len:879 (+),score=122.01 TRINITY_DN17948_c0_g4_i1:133-2769(+)
MGVASSGEGRERRVACCYSALPEEAHPLQDPETGSSPSRVTVDQAATLVPRASRSSGKSVVQFGSSDYYVSESEGQVQIDIVRMGDIGGEASFTYNTVDGSAKAGKKYVAQADTCTFLPGERVKVINVDVVQDECWDATLEFGVVITNVKGAHRGKQAFQCTVKIIDDDCFPTNKFEGFVDDEESIENIFGPSLFFQYVVMNFSNKTFSRGFLLIVFFDALKAAYFFLTLYMQVYLVDHVLVSRDEDMQEGEHEERKLMVNSIDSGARAVARALGAEVYGYGFGGDDVNSKNKTAIAVGCLYIIPFTLSHLCDYLKPSLGLQEVARKTLQANLFRKFLHYTEKVRDSISVGDLTMAMARDISEVVDNGLMRFLEGVSIMMKLAVALAFILEENKMAAVPLGIFPVVMGVFMMAREKPTNNAAEAMASQQNNLVHQIQDAVRNFPLVSDFQLKSHVVEAYEASIDLYNKKSRHSQQIVTNNTYLSSWLTTLLIGIYMMIGSRQVVSLGGTVSLGTFIATINVFKEIGVELRELYLAFMEVQSTYGPLRKLTFFFNQPTDLNDRMKVGRSRRDMGTLKLAELVQRKQDSTPPKAAQLSEEGDVKEVKEVKDRENFFIEDLMTVELRDVTFSYPGVSHPVCFKVNYEFEQGKLYGFIGRRHQGKATLLKLLAEVLLLEPDSGHVFVPTHMRILHINKDVGILHGSLINNLIFNNDKQTCGGMRRIREICEMCGFTSRMLAELHDEPAPGTRRPSLVTNHALVQETIPYISGKTWETGMSQADYARLSIARALILNPECLIMHMPFISFNDQCTKELTMLMRRHVEEKGLQFPASEKALRRPRTVFFSSSALERCYLAHQVFEVSIGNGIKCVHGSASSSKR